MYIPSRISIGNGIVGCPQTVYQDCQLLGMRDYPKSINDAKGGDEVLLRSSDGATFFSLRKYRNGLTETERVTEIDSATASVLLEEIRASNQRFVFVTEVTDPLPE